MDFPLGYGKNKDLVKTHRANELENGKPFLKQIQLHAFQKNQFL